MDFDPDKYIAAHGGFDPDAYIAAHEQAPVAAPVAPHAARPQHGPREYTDEQLGLDTGAIKRSPLMGGLAESTLGRAGANLRDDIKGTDVVPGGLGRAQPTGKAPVGPMPDKLERDAGPMANDWLAQGITGAAFGEGAGEVAGPLLSRAGDLSPLIQKVAPVVRAAIEGGANSKSQGGDATGGAVIGGGLALLGPLGRAIINSKGGKARQFIEEHGGEVGLDTPGQKGPFEHMDVPVNHTTDAQIGEQASASAERGLDMLNKEKQAALRPTGKLIEQINESPAGLAKRNIDALVPELQDAVGAFGTSASAEGDLQRVLNKITEHQKPGFNPAVHPYELSEADLNLAKRDLDRAARTGVSNAEKLSPLKRAATATRDMVDQGPYKIPNEMYANDAFKYRQSRRLLGVNERPTTPDETQTAVNTVKNRITRRGQNTVTAGGQEPKLKAFEKRHPDIGLELAKPGMLRARGDLSFRVLPKEHGGLIDRGSSVVSTVGAAELLSNLLGHGHVSPLKAVAALLSAATVKNAPAIEGRMLYPMAKAMSGGGAKKMLPLFEAARAATQRPPSMNEALGSLNMTGPNRKENQ